ncbi:GNAT family N-acetyltransferase [Actinomadura luteofluorescens]|uniref:GNAT family N-acetyltransferase n=1 Tax=Actinomadura luteofluorescens TaxID=46163 RepID=UPI003634601A
MERAPEVAGGPRPAAAAHPGGQDTRHPPHPRRDREAPPARAALVPGSTRHRSPAQGNGLGAALLRSRLDRCDTEGLPAYLESSKERNVPYYERFGFRVTRELPLPGKGCPPVWLMWRDPGR